VLRKPYCSGRLVRGGPFGAFTKPNGYDTHFEFLNRKMHNEACNRGRRIAAHRPLCPSTTRVDHSSWSNSTRCRASWARIKDQVCLANGVAAEVGSGAQGKVSRRATSPSRPIRGSWGASRQSLVPCAPRFGTCDPRRKQFRPRVPRRGAVEIRRYADSRARSTSRCFIDGLWLGGAGPATHSVPSRRCPMIARINFLEPRR